MCRSRSLLPAWNLQDLGVLPRLNLQRSMLAWRLDTASRASGRRIGREQRVLLEGPARQVWRNVLDLVAGPWWLLSLGLVIVAIPFEAWLPMPGPYLGLALPLIPASMYAVAAVVRVRNSLGARATERITLDVRRPGLLTGLSLAGYGLALVLTLAIGWAIFGHNG